MTLLGRVETLTSQLSQLSSMTLVLSTSSSRIRARPNAVDEELEAIRYATRILEYIQRPRLCNVQVELELYAIASFGGWLSRRDKRDGALLREACGALEEALWGFEAPGCLVFRRPRNPRAGRMKFWLPSIKQSFPTLSQRELLVLTGKPSPDHFCYIQLDGPTANSSSDPVGHEGEVTSLITSNDSK